MEYDLSGILFLVALGLGWLLNKAAEYLDRRFPWKL